MKTAGLIVSDVNSICLLNIVIWICAGHSFYLTLNMKIEKKLFMPLMGNIVTLWLTFSHIACRQKVSSNAKGSLFLFSHIHILFNSTLFLNRYNKDELSGHCRCNSILKKGWISLCHSLPLQLLDRVLAF